MQILTEVEENMIEKITADDHDPEIEEDRDLEIVDVQDQGIAKKALVIDPDQKSRGKNVRGPEAEREKEAGEAEARKKKGQKIEGNLGINL